MAKLGTLDFETETTLPRLQWVDKNMGQLQKMEQFNTIPMPAILIEFGYGSWQTLGRQQQTGEVTLRIYTLYENYADSQQGSINQNQALLFYDFTEHVHKALQGFGAANFTSLQRTADEEDNDHGNMIVSVSEYSTIITDDSASKENNTLLVEPPLKVEREQPPLPDEEFTIKSDFAFEK